MKIPFDINGCCELARLAKEHQVSENLSDSATMIFWRDDRPLSIVNTPHDKDVFLKVAEVLICGLAATGMVLCSDQYSTELEQHPDGRDWEPGEFQELFEAGRGEEFQIVENLVVTRYVRNPGLPYGHGCQNTTRVLEFHVNENNVVWGQTRGSRLEGWMTRVINSYFEQEPMDLDDIRVVGIDNPYKDLPYQRLHADLGSLRAVAAMFPITLGYFAKGDDPEETAIVDAAIKKMGQDGEWLKRAVGVITN